MILADQITDGKARRTLVHFDRNGFGYTLDRVTGELLVPCSQMIRVSFRSWARLWVRTERSGGRRSLTERTMISIVELEEFMGRLDFGRSGLKTPRTKLLRESQESRKS